MPPCIPPTTSPTFPPPDLRPKNVFSCSILTASNLPGGNVLSPYNLQLQVQSDLIGWSAAITSGSLPPGITMSNSGVISGTPTTVGTYNFQVTVTKTTFMSCYQDFTMVVSAPICTITTDSNLPAGYVGLAYSTQLTVDAVANVTGWTVTNGTLPAGLTMSNTGLITGTPLTAGTSTFTVTVTGDQGMSCSQAFTLNTVNQPCAPYPGGNITAAVQGDYASNGSVSGHNITIQLGKQCVINFTSNPSVIQGVTGSWSCPAGCNPPSYEILPGVWFGVVTSGSDPLNEIGHAAITAAPAGAVGTATFTVRATLNDCRYIEQVFSVSVVGGGGGGSCNLVGNQATFPFNFSLGQHVNYQCTYTGSPSMPLHWSISSGTLPPGLSLNSSTGIISGTIPNNAGHGSIGSFGLDLNGVCAVALSWTII